MPYGKPRMNGKVKRDAHPATGIGQFRHVYKSLIADEEAAFAYLIQRGISQPKYKWQPEHTDKVWRWRRTA